MDTVIEKNIMNCNKKRLLYDMCDCVHWEYIDEKKMNKMRK